MTRHQYGISALVSQTSFGGEISGSVAKCRLFTQTRTTLAQCRVGHAFHKLSVILTFATVFLPNTGSRCHDL